MTLFPKVVELLREQGGEDIIVFGGGIIPEADFEPLKQAGIAQLFTPGAPTTEIVDWVNANIGERTGS